MFNNIYEYISRLISIVKPKNILYIAIDGVAPRAKMNQQRSRRFRAAYEAETLRNKEKQLIEEWTHKGLTVPKLKEAFDSNIITPGTEFMAILSKCLKEYIINRLKFDTRWKHLTVFYNDANVPGEGEHKILDFIKSQRSMILYK